MRDMGVVVTGFHLVGGTKYSREKRNQMISFCCMIPQFFKRSGLDWDLISQWAAMGQSRGMWGLVYVPQRSQAALPTPLPTTLPIWPLPPSLWAGKAPAQHTAKASWLRSYSDHLPGPTLLLLFDFFNTAVWRYNSHTIQLTHFKCTVQRFFWHIIWLIFWRCGKYI